MIDSSLASISLLRNIRAAWTLLRNIRTGYLPDPFLAIQEINNLQVRTFYATWFMNSTCFRSTVRSCVHKNAHRASLPLQSVQSVQSSAPSLANADHKFTVFSCLSRSFIFIEQILHDLEWGRLATKWNNISPHNISYPSKKYFYSTWWALRETQTQLKVSWRMK